MNWSIDDWRMPVGRGQGSKRCDTTTNYKQMVCVCVCAALEHTGSRCAKTRVHLSVRKPKIEIQARLHFLAV